MFAREKQELGEGLGLKERDRWIDDVQVQVVRVPESKIVRMLPREGSCVYNGALMARGLARMYDR
jgi:hypothetical protein